MNLLSVVYLVRKYVLSQKWEMITMNPRGSIGEVSINKKIEYYIKIQRFNAGCNILHSGMLVYVYLLFAFKTIILFV